ncbi:MAG: hypothetical protein EOR97_17075 [Mesorhizobium sp.]|uniref:hypothetical protein n=1 Tax=Mesorhizobium sp. TaxID=1871066 RepID=UPI000FE8244D|nr:hypothetical protein [Mesorhizobium sp.]RWN30085.1 MAG: hypothetical protein EOR97_17075 [Mesorhizobium sp.]
MIKKAQAASSEENFNALVSAGTGNSNVASGRKAPKMPDRRDNDEDHRIDDREQLVRADADRFGERSHACPLGVGIRKARPFDAGIVYRDHALGPESQPRQRAARHAIHCRPRQNDALAA